MSSKAELENKLYARKQELGDQVRWGKITPDFALEMMIFETLAYARGVIGTIRDDGALSLEDLAGTITISI